MINDTHWRLAGIESQIELMRETIQNILSRQMHLIVHGLRNPRHQPEQVNNIRPPPVVGEQQDEEEEEEEEEEDNELQSPPISPEAQCQPLGSPHRQRPADEKKVHGKSPTTPRSRQRQHDTSATRSSADGK